MRICLALTITALVLMSDSAHGRSLCGSGEAAYFSCAVKSGTLRKIVSLCASQTPALSPRSTSLTYRFGRPGKIELAFPRRQIGGEERELFRFAHYFRFQTDYVEVTFDTSDARYAVYSRDEAGASRAGVTVTVNGRETDYACVNQPTVNRLHELKHLLPCDNDNALSQGACEPTQR